jgi:hypothetical protein
MFTQRYRNIVGALHVSQDWVGSLYSMTQLLLMMIVLGTEGVNEILCASLEVVNSGVGL